MLLRVVLPLFILFVGFIHSQGGTLITKIGEPIEKEISSTKTDYYYIPLQTLFHGLNMTDRASVVVTPMYGDVDLLISENVYGEQVVIKQDDPQITKHVYPNLKIAIFAPNDGIYAKSKYTINVLTTKAQITLDNGLPQICGQFGSDYTFFQFYLDQHVGIHVSLTPVTGSGDPDLYLSALHLKPDQWTPYEDKYHSFDIDNDVIVALPTDQQYRSNKTWGVGVYSIYQAHFFYSLSWVKDGTYLQLMEGVPQASEVKKKAYRYFKFTLPQLQTGKSRLILTLTNKYPLGDPDLYVNGPSKPDYPLPSAHFGEHEYSHTDRGSDILIIHNAPIGDYKIAVYGFEDSDYTITALTEGSIVLITDRMKPLSVQIEKEEYMYFKYPNIDEENEIFITVTMTNGHGYLYLAKPSSHNPRPTKDPAKHDDEGQYLDGKLFFHYKKKTEFGDYYFSIYAVTAFNGSVYITTNQSHTLLQNEVEKFGEDVPRASYRYYYFDKVPGAKETLTITSVPELGDVELYVSTTEVRPGDPRDLKKYAWKSTNYQTDTVAVFSDDPKIKGNRYYIGVKGSNYYQVNKYSIIAYSSNDPIELSEGVKLGGSVNPEGRVQFKFYLHTPSSIMMVVNKQNQDDELHFYVNYNKPGPSHEDHKYASSSFVTEFLEVKDAYGGWWYIAVEGVKKTEEHIYFDIAFTANYRFCDVNLDTNLEITDEVKIEQIHTYIPNDADYVLISSSLISGDTELYVTTNGTSLDVGPNNYVWKEVSWPGNSMLIDAKDPKFHPRDWAIGVKANHHSNYLFSIDTIPSGFGSMIYENLPKRLKLPKCEASPCTKHVKYRFGVGEYKGKPAPEYFYVSVRVIKGSVGVYVNQDSMVDPGPDAPDTWKSEGTNDRIITLTNDGSPKLLDGSVFIGVYGLHQNEESIAEIFYYKHSSPQYINHDQFKMKKMDVAIPQYWTVMAMQSKKKEDYQGKIYVESCDNYNVPMFYVNVKVRDKDKDPHPSPSQHDESSAPIRKDQYVGVISQYVSIAGYENPELYYLMIESKQPNMISIFVTSHDQDSRPTPSNSLLTGKMKGGKFNVHVPLANPSTRFPNRELFYEVYYAEVLLKKEKPEKLNFQTVCAIESFGKLVTTVSSTSVKTAFDAALVISKKKVYKVNVVVRDDFGLKSSYDELWIIKGKGQREYGEKHHHHLVIWWVGWTVLLLFFLLVLVYFIVGVIILLIKGERGWDVIPHKDFFLDLPALCFDGILFIFTLGKRKSKNQYKSMRDEEEDVSGIGSINVDDSNTVGEGYGSL